MPRWPSSSSGSTGTGGRREAEFARALELNPGHAPSRQWHAMFLASRSRFDAALAEMRMALDLDPLSLVIQSGHRPHPPLCGTRFDEAIAQYEHVLQTNPSFGQACIDLAFTKMARRLAVGADQPRARRRSFSATSRRSCCCRAFVRSARDTWTRDGAAFDELRAWHERGDAGVDDLALLAAMLGECQSALEWLPEACAQRAPFLATSTSSPRWRRWCRIRLPRAASPHGFRAGASAQAAGMAIAATR